MNQKLKEITCGRHITSTNISGTFIKITRITMIMMKNVLNVQIVELHSIRLKDQHETEENKATPVPASELEIPLFPLENRNKVRYTPL